MATVTASAWCFYREPGRLGAKVAVADNCQEKHQAALVFELFTS